MIGLTVTISELCATEDRRSKQFNSSTVYGGGAQLIQDWAGGWRGPRGVFARAAPGREGQP